VALTWHGFDRPGLATAGRILGSWLIAIGLLLAGASIVPRHVVALAPVAPPPPAEPLSRPQGFDPNLPETQPPAPSRPRFLGPGDDSAQQP
jgi:hypothetical protein